MYARGGIAAGAAVFFLLRGDMQTSEGAIRACYDAALEVRSNRLAPMQAVARAVAASGMNQGSAQACISNIRSLLAGKFYKRTMTSFDTLRILDWIKEDSGVEVAQAAAENVLEHVKYYAALPRGGPQVKVKKTTEEFLSRLGPQDKIAIDVLFEIAVENALASSPCDREKRLQNADPVPKSITVITRSFVRNADVVAEVLYRANGHCGWCKKAAPFQKFKTSTPYLEVHHRIPLAENGEDTVANAIALCPNCHREAHFGLNKATFRQ
jgi:5-methylcytosine-specific restriction enzyme A